MTSWCSICLSVCLSVYLSIYLSITNRLVAIVHIKPVIAILVRKVVAMATSLRTSKLALCSSDSLIPKTTPTIKQLSYNQSYSPSKAKKPVIPKCVQNRLPWQRPLAPVDSHLTCDSLGRSKPTTQTASRSIQLSLQRDDRRVSLYFTMGCPSPSKLPFPWEIWAQRTMY